MSLLQFYFAYHAIVILISSLMVITRRNPVHSVMFMLFLFFHIASLYLFLNAEFIAAIQIIIYAGAILVLFLFVIFLIDIKRESVSRRFINQWPTSVVVSLALLSAFAVALQDFVMGPTGKYSVDYINENTHVAVIGQAMYTEYIFPFEIASLILLVGLIGAIVLAKKKIKK